MAALSLEECKVLDRRDPLRTMRAAFALEPNLIHLDGNSPGALPRATPERVAQTVTQQWGEGLIRSCKSAGWFDPASRVGDKIARSIGGNPGEVLLLTHVNDRTGAMHDRVAASAAAHAIGALTAWGLARSAGAVPVDLRGSNADFAVGCGSRSLNGGSSAPAVVWVHPQHVDRCEQPLSGW